MLKEDLIARIILVAGLIVAVAAVIYWATLPFATLVTYIPDDSFYYFQPASLMAQGVVPSFDGIHAGNGFHPLWMFLLVPIFLLKSVDLYLPIHLSLILAGFFYVFTAFNIHRILNLLGVSKLFSACAASTFVIFPFGLVRSVDGEVTPLNILMISFLLLNFIRLLGSTSPKPRQLIMLGVWAGLVYLARNDNIFLLLLLLIFYWVSQRKTEYRRRDLLWIACSAIAVVIPWFLYNLIVFHTIIPGSVWAVPFINRAHLEASHPGLMNGILFSARSVFKSINALLYFSPLNLGILIVYGVVLAHLAFGDAKNKQASALIMTLILFICLLFLINTGVRLYLRDWHLGAAFLVNHLAVWYSLFLLAKRISRKLLFASISASALLALFVVNLLIVANEPINPWQTEMWAAGRWASEHPQSRFGAFNCGIIAYFGAGNVVDLDGNMNNSAFEAIKKRELYDYCHQENISYILDFDSTVLAYYRMFWPSEKLDGIVLVGWQNDDPAIVFPHGEADAERDGDPIAAQIKGKHCIFEVK